MKDKSHQSFPPSPLHFTVSSRSQWNANAWIYLILVNVLQTTCSRTMALSSQSFFLLGLVAIVLLASPTHAFGAGNIASLSQIEGQNFRHGDVEDALLTLLMARVAGGKKFSKLDVKRVYFGNWLRDYSQAVDVGTVKYVSAEAIRILLWVLGFITFG